VLRMVEIVEEHLAQKAQVADATVE
jgi:hypothetical protein